MSPLFLQALQTALGGKRGLVYIYSGRVIAGFGIGGISAVAPTFVSECAPKEVRGRITGLFQIMVATGVMLSYWINCESSPFWHLLWLTAMLWLLSGSVSASQSLGVCVEGSIGVSTRSSRIDAPWPPHCKG